jgi:hypothetical protein
MTHRKLSIALLIGATLALGACESTSYKEESYQGDSASHGSHAPSSGPTQAAESACFNRFGEPGHQNIKMFTPLKPGYWEVIITGRHGRQVACTVDQYGTIVDWVNM